MVSDPHGRHTNSAGRGVHQHPLAAFQAGKIDQPVVRRPECDGDRCCLRKRVASGNPYQEPTVDVRDRRAHGTHQPHHTIAGMQVMYIGSNPYYHPGALTADTRLAGVHAECYQHVTEVQTGGTHFDPYLTGRERILRLFIWDQREAVESTLTLHVQPPPIAIARRGKQVT